MWLKISYKDDNASQWWSGQKCEIKITLESGKTAPISPDLNSFRASPIFPLIKDASIELTNTTLYFFCFANAYRVLGRIEQIGSIELRKAVFFSCGLSSVILITSDKDVLTEFRFVANQPENAFEEWIVVNSLIDKINYNIQEISVQKPETVTIADYSILELTERALIDEFKISISLILLKLHKHMPSELLKIQRLIEEINDLVIELIYLETLSGTHPDTLSEYNLEDLKDKKTRNIIKHQNLDRIIQVNSALSYVSTQAFSGATPILERRSLVRRHSLLGIGSAILALNNIARFIESCFSKIFFEDVIVDRMSKAAPLPGLEDLHDHNPAKWRSSAIEQFSKSPIVDNPYFKLPFFNGRLGFRETEYSISAAIQSISSGASLEWSLMTVTHEMLHGHVRDIMKFIFYGDDDIKDDEQRKQYYEKFWLKIKKKKESEYLIDSLRTIIFSYCCLSLTHGSLTVKKDNPGKFKIVLPDEDLLWNTFERENRNINELFVHVLDLHYFYASRVSVYIPLIWCSWVSVPYINGDLRQYILRSILTISSTISGSVFDRFDLSVKRLKELLEMYQDGKLNHPVITHVLKIMDDQDFIMKYYFPAFKTSLIIVDMIDKIFIVGEIRSAIFSDTHVHWENEENIEGAFEKVYKYSIDNAFNDDIIKSPIAYLLNRMINELNSENNIDELERETAIEFLALNSN